MEDREIQQHSGYLFTWLLYSLPSCECWSCRRLWVCGSIKKLQKQGATPGVPLNQLHCVSMLCFPKQSAKTLPLYKAAFVLSCETRWSRMCWPPQSIKIWQLELQRRTDKMGISDRVKGYSLQSEDQKGKGLGFTEPRILRIYGAQTDSPNSKTLWVGDILWNVTRV